MGIIGRLFDALSAGKERVKIGGIQGKLKFHLTRPGSDPDRIKELIEELCAAAWNINILVAFFTGYGYTFEDFVAMYSAITFAHPTLIVERENLLATSILIDNYEKLETGLRAMSQAVTETPRHERPTILAKLMLDSVDDLVRCLPTK